MLYDGSLLTLILYLCSCNIFSLDRLLKRRNRRNTRPRLSDFVIKPRRVEKWILSLEKKNKCTASKSRMDTRNYCGPYEFSDGVAALVAEVTDDKALKKSRAQSPSRRDRL